LHRTLWSGDRVFLLAILGMILTLAGCGNSSSNSLEAPALTVSPQALYVLAGSSVQINAMVTGVSDNTINYTLGSTSGAAGSSGTGLAQQSQGQISTTGLYIAPQVTQPTSVTVVATSAADPSLTATVQITVLLPGAVTATANPLVAQYSFILPKDGNVTVHFGTSTGYGLQTWSQAAPTGGGTVNILVAGMTQNTTYHMSASVQFADGTQFNDQDQTFTTGTIPTANIPSIKVSNPSGVGAGNGIELLDLVNTTGNTNLISTAATDLNGNMIWYISPAVPAGSLAFPLKLLANGHMMMDISTGSYNPGTPSTIEETDLAGNIVWQTTASQMTAALASMGLNYTIGEFHHDLLPLPNGHLIVLANTVENYNDLPGYPGTTGVIGDLLIDLDQNRNPVWVWSSFDHLDVNRHPMYFPDWTHSNAILYSADDGNLLLSMRHQSWIIKIDYEDGKGTGNIIWRLGEGGDFTLQGGTDPVDWFYAQHGPKIITPNSTGVFQLGVFDNGNNRIVDSSGTVCGSPGAVACYSTVPILSVDENVKTASIIWRYNPQVFSIFGGNVENLTNGDIEFDICAFSQTPPGAQIMEVTDQQNAQSVWQMNVSGQYAYRAFRIPSLYPGVQW
jgi:arylsulfate sulfotransferase